MAKQLRKYKRPLLIRLETQKKIKNYNEAEQNSIATSLVHKLLNMLGVSSGKTEHHLEAVKFINDDMTHYTYEEIEHAFKLYIARKLGLEVYQQLNAVVIGNVMAQYEKYKIDKLKLYRQKRALPPTKEENEETKTKIMHEACTRAFDEWTINREIEGMTSHIYDYLDSQDLMNKDINYKKFTFNKAKRILTAKNKARKGLTYADHISIKTEMEAITKGKGSVVIKSKEIALRDYFNELIQEGKHIKEVLN